MPKNNIEHELTLWRILEPQRWKFQRRKTPAIQKVNDTPAVHRIARQPIRVPSQNSVCLTVLNLFQHFPKYRTARNFGALLFNKDINDIQIFLFRKGAQFCNLVINRTHLFIFHIGGLAGIKKKFIVVHAHIFLVNNWAKQMKRDRITIARESNLVLANREARLCAPSGEDLSGGNAWAALRAASEMVGKF
ncbi:hypothetical protein HYW18_00435, partial [Candidatus Uhrbacteria bacterium]|nr:hypothetical protein [Candidatus Uhrbacteria bacterium]